MVVTLKFILLLFNILSINAGTIKVKERDYCLSLDDYPYPYFSTITAYELVRRNEQSSNGK
jgi:hypothetical protein